jgi:hypothetical protein
MRQPRRAGPAAAARAAADPATAAVCISTGWAEIRASSYVSAGGWPTRRVLDRSPGLRAHHRQGRQQAATGTHRRGKGVPWPTTAAGTESELASGDKPCLDPARQQMPVISNEIAQFCQANRRDRS